MEESMVFPDDIFPLEEDDIIMSKLVDSTELQDNPTSLLSNVLQRSQQQQKQERRFFPTDQSLQSSKFDNDIDRLFDEYYEPKQTQQQSQQQQQQQQQQVQPSPSPPPSSFPPPLPTTSFASNETTLTPRFRQVTMQTPTSSSQKVVRPKVIKPPSLHNDQQQQQQPQQQPLQRLTNVPSSAPPSLLRNMSQCLSVSSNSVSSSSIQAPTPSHLHRCRPPISLVIPSPSPVSVDESKANFGDDSDESQTENISTSDDSPRPSSFDKAKNAARRRNAKENVRKRKAGIADSPSDTKIDTNGDERESKRHQRLLRNRVSAQLSRERKKAYVTRLEGQLKSLIENNENLSSQVKTLNIENLDLKKKLTIASDRGSSSSSSSVSASSPECPPSPDLPTQETTKQESCKQQQLQITSVDSNKPAKSSEVQTGVTIFAMMLFAAMINRGLGISSKPLPQSDNESSPKIVHPSIDLNLEDSLIKKSA